MPVRQNDVLKQGLELVFFLLLLKTNTKYNYSIINETTYEKEKVSVANSNDAVCNACNTNEVLNTNGNANLDYGGIDDSEVHAHTYSVWDEE